MQSAHRTAAFPFRAVARPAGELGVEVHDLDATALDAAAAAELRRLVYEHKLVVFRGLELGDDAYIAFARKLGRPQIYFQPNYHHPEHPEIFVSANVPIDGKKVGVAGTGRYWHTDYQFFTDPLPLVMVTPRVIPAGGRGTCYVDMQKVLRDLPADLKPHVERTRARHEAKWRYKVQACDIDKSIAEILEEFGAETPPVTHPTVITHPVHGRRALYVSRGFTVGIEGLGYEEGKAALEALFDFTERPEHVHKEPWVPGTTLLWDNRQLVHMASGSLHGAASVSYRIGVYDDLPFYTEEPSGRLA
jgi:taurine dioxygenase